ncbi:MAG: L-threonylcarbamoyladenylate synthase, partial [Candidatus Nanopelagicaceae bacterium]
MAQSQFVSNCTMDALKQAAKSLKEGHLVAFPTETVYGLGADANNESAVSQIYKVKGRPQDHPLIVHIADWQTMGDWAEEIPDFAIDLARAFWPGPMTLILKRSELAKDFITGSQNTVGIRVPNQSLALQLLTEFSKLGGKGVAAPSANRFGQVSPTTAQAVQEELSAFLDEKDAILDGGPCAVGVESTIIDCTSTNPRILRPGAITIEDIKGVTGLDVVLVERSDIRVSGSLENHYAPNAQVLLDIEPLPGDGFIALAEI